MQRLYQYKAKLNHGIGLGELIENSEEQLPCDLNGVYYCEDCVNCLGIRSKATHIANKYGYEKYLCLRHARNFLKINNDNTDNSHSLISFCLPFDEIRQLDQTKPIGLVPFSKQECLSIYHLNLGVYTKQMRDLSRTFLNDPFIIKIYIHPEQSKTFFKIDPWSRSELLIKQKYPQELLISYWKELKNLVLFYDFRNDNLIYELMLNRIEDDFFVQ